MGMFDNEVAATNKLREYDKLSQSPASGTLESVGEALSAVSEASGLSPIGSIARGFNVSGKFLSLGVPTVEENLKFLGDSTEKCLSRVEEELHKQGLTVDEIKTRIESDEFAEGMASAVLQSQRTTNNKRLMRMAHILANGIKDKELKPEILDYMMRASVELEDRDILFLKFICDKQQKILEDGLRFSDHWLANVQSSWQASAFERGVVITQAKTDDFGWRSALTRLQAFGFITAVQGNLGMNSPSNEPYALLPEGLSFIQRIKEIADE